MAGRWRPLVQVLERSGKGDAGPFGYLLLLERRTAAESRCTATGRDGRDSSGVRRPRIGLLDNSLGQGPATERAHLWRLLARRSTGHEHPRRPRRSKTCRAHRRATEALENNEELVIVRCRCDLRRIFQDSRLRASAYYHSAKGES